jgi:hypothetical protein
VTETNRAIAAKQKLALASERDRAQALTRELTSVRNELEALEAGKRQIGGLKALRVLRAGGISGDLARARELYERAQAGGIENAKEQIETLK